MSPTGSTEMNTVNLKEALLEKYWTNSSEKRINRKQFILRLVLIMIAGWIASSIVAIVIPSIPEDEAMSLAFGGKVTSIWFAVNAIISLVVYYPFYRMNKILYIKRYADFNNNGKSPRVLLPISYYGLVLVTLLGVIIAYTGGPNAYGSNDVLDSLLLPIVMILGFSSYLYIAAMFCLLLMFIIALFTSGTKDSNNYGSVPTGNPLI